MADIEDTLKTQSEITDEIKENEKKKRRIC